MSDLKAIVPKADSQFLARSNRIKTEVHKQRKLMLGSLCLLLLALGIVIWRNRDFWFPDADDADSDQTVETYPIANVAPVRPTAPTARASSTVKSKHQAKLHAPASVPQPANPPVAAATTTRTVLPPLEVEVVAGDSHRTIRPGSNSVHVDLQPGMPPQSDSEPATVAETEPAANVTNAAEHVQMSTSTSDVLTRPVKPNYPLLARQMKVQGSVILQALIGRDGIIQNLRVVSGPHILASAAEDAVRQWHFKPHLEGTEAVETQAKITVNFTISTN